MKKNNGQVLIVILLAMVIAVTVALSVASRSITNIRTATQSEEAQIAYGAAEAGIEEVLRQGVDEILRKVAAGESIPSGTVGQAQYTTALTPVGGKVASYPGIYQTLDAVKKDESLQVDLYGGTGIVSVDIYWGIGYDPGQAPALEISRIYAKDTYGTGDPSDDTFKVEKNLFNAECLATMTGQSAPFDTVGCKKSSVGDPIPEILGDNYSNRVSINLDCPSGFSGCTPMLLRIKSLFNRTKILVQVKPDTATLPTQGVVIESTGTYKDSTKKIQIMKPYSNLPAVFDYVLYSGSDLSK